MRYIQQALQKSYLEHPGSACCTDDMFEICALGRTSLTSVPQSSLSLKRTCSLGHPSRGAAVGTTVIDWSEWLNG